MVADHALSSWTPRSPGHMSAVTGHHYANPTNHFWHCLHLSGTFPIPADLSPISKKKQSQDLRRDYCSLQKIVHFQSDIILGLCVLFRGPSFPAQIHIFSSSFPLFSDSRKPPLCKRRLISLSAHRSRKLSYQPKRWPPLCQRC